MNHQTLTILRRTLLPLTLVFMASAWHLSANADTRHIVIEQGDSALSKEAARESKEQWDSTRSLRNKVNTRTEKEFDKFDKSIDLQERCNISTNLNAYWESNSRRCLDRHTGRQITP